MRRCLGGKKKKRTWGRERKKKKEKTDLIDKLVLSQEQYIKHETDYMTRVCCKRV
jgi:hypothetical protein